MATASTPRSSPIPIQDWPDNLSSVNNNGGIPSVFPQPSLPVPTTTTVEPVIVPSSVLPSSSSFTVSPLSSSRPDPKAFDSNVNDTPNPLIPLSSCTERIRTYLVNHSTYFRLHFLYFAVLGHVTALIMYGIEGFQYSYVDCLYMTYSALCMVGLATLDVSKLTLASQIILLIAVLLGGIVLLSVAPVLLRRHYFEAKAAETIDNEEERKNILQELTTEYRALGYIRNIVFIYWITVQLGIFLLLGLSIVTDPATLAIMEQRNVNPWWWAFFHAVTAFNNAGFGLFSDNLIPVATSSSVLILLSIAILSGNTMYPINVRIIVWFCHRFVWPNDAAFKFLLDRPRKCFSHMFRAEQTKILSFMLIALALIDFFTFLGLDYDRPFLAAFTGPQRAMIGWFQAISTRTAGFNTIDLSLCAAGMQVMYAWMMYVAAYPTVITIRKSTDAEEKLKQEAKLIRTEIEEMEERDNEINEVLQAEGIPIMDPYGEIEIKEVPESEEDGAPSTFDGSRRTSTQNTVKGGTGIGVKNSDISVMFQDTDRTPQKDRMDRGEVESNRSNDIPSPSRSARVPPERSTLPHVQSKQEQQLVPKLSLVSTSTATTPNLRRPGITPDPKSTLRNRKLLRSGSRAFFDNSYYESARQLNIRRNSFGGESTLEMDIPIPLQYSEEAQRKRLLEKYKDKEPHTVVDQARNLIARDISILFLGFLAICIAESLKVEEDPTKALNNWSIFFEVVSAFGTVGLTLGYPGFASSLSTIFSPFSKFVIMGIMLAGRHRGLPSSIDPAVYLPALLNRTKSRRNAEIGSNGSTTNAGGSTIDNGSMLEFGSVIERMNSLSLVVRQKLNLSPSPAANLRTVTRVQYTTGRSSYTPSKSQRTMPPSLEATHLAAIARNVAQSKYADSRKGTQSERKLPIEGGGMNRTVGGERDGNDTTNLRRSLAHIFQPPITTFTTTKDEKEVSMVTARNERTVLPDSIAEVAESPTTIELPVLVRNDD